VAQTSLPFTGIDVSLLLGGACVMLGAGLLIRVAVSRYRISQDD
jgi:hypothetical protein